MNISGLMSRMEESREKRKIQIKNHLLDELNKLLKSFLDGNLDDKYDAHAQREILKLFLDPLEIKIITISSAVFDKKTIRKFANTVRANILAAKEEYDKEVQRLNESI